MTGEITKEEDRLGVKINLKQNYLTGVSLYTRINIGISSFGFEEGPITSPHSCGIIAQCLDYAPGAYLEIGSRYGGSTLVGAVLADHVVAIDPGYKEEFDQVVDAFNGWSKITKIEKPSETVKKLPKHNYTVGFIDGLHEYDNVYQDFLLMSKRVSDFIIFDDFDIPDVYDAAMDIVNSQSKWRLVHAAYSTAVLSTQNKQENALGVF